MSILRKNTISTKFLKDKNLTLSAKGLFSLILTDNIDKAIDLEDYCSNSIMDIKSIILELRIEKYLKFNLEDGTLDAYPISYNKMKQKEKELER